MNTGNENKIEPKISLPEAYFLIAFAIIADLINWIPIINWLVTLITLPGFQFYFAMKGVRGVYSLAGNLIEFVPVLSVLPAITAGIIATIIIDRLEANKLGQLATQGLAKARPIAKTTTSQR